MSNEPSSPPDLAAIDLSLSFAPAWAKESDSGERLAKLAAKHGGEERPGRSGGKWQDRGGKSDRRPPRRDGGGRPAGGGRPERGGHGRREERRPERPKPEPILDGWEVQFMPDRHGVDGLAKQIKTSAKAYPLFDLARLVLEKSERYLVGFRRSTETATPLFQLKSDGSLWLTESEAVAHALATQMDKFYRRERIAVDPPKGTYPFVAVCGMSGVLLGPPNYHDYQSKLIRLHAEKFANMPFEAFKSRIRMERDEALIEKWKEEQSSRDVFYAIDPSAPPKPAPAPEPAAPAVAAEASESVAAASGEVAVPEAEETAPAVEAAVPEASAEAPVESAEPVADTEIVVGEAPAEEAAPADDNAKKFDSFAEVERHFRENHAAKAVIRIRDKVVVAGPAALNESAPAVLRLTRGTWEELDRFPLPLAHILGQQLTAKGLQIFKTQDNVTHVGVARPRHLDVAVTPVSEALSAMLAYIEAHRAVPRAEQWKALVELRPLAEGGSEVLRETAAAADLFWLLREGHVIDFAKRGLEAARRPKPPQQAKAKKTPAPVAAASAKEQGAPAAPVAETPAEPVAETAAEPVAETPAEPVAETPAEPVAETPAEPVAETPAEPVAETPAEPVAETPAEPVAETPAEPVAETPAEPVAETSAEPVTETAAEPVAETPAEPVTEIAAEPAAETPAKPVAVPAQDELALQPQQ